MVETKVIVKTVNKVFYFIHDLPVIIKQYQNDKFGRFGYFCEFVKQRREQLKWIETPTSKQSFLSSKQL